MKRAEVQNLIKKLGGPKVVAAHLRKLDGNPPTPNAISQWKQIPVHCCPTVERLCREAKVVRSNGQPYTCELFHPTVEWASVRYQLG
jgi:hypothetical protein